jgi:hypothetical protein
MSPTGGRRPAPTRGVFAIEEHELVAIEVWDASKRLPQDVLDALPLPGKAQSAAV